MTKESLRSSSWHPMVPDPDTFTQLCSDIGVQGIQIEQLTEIDREAIHQLGPIHGLILMIKHKSSESLPSSSLKSSNNSSKVYFSSQVTHDAYTMHALLNVLMNCTESIDTGKVLNRFKQCTHDLSPTLKGLTLTNNSAFRDAHNNLIRTRSPSSSIASTKDIYQTISYIEMDGYVWELDGLKRGPLNLGPCDKENGWLDVAYKEINKKREIYRKQNLPVSLWSVMEDRKLYYQRKLVEKMNIKHKIELILNMHQPGWRGTNNARHWEEEYNYTIHRNERMKRGHVLSKQLLSSEVSLDPCSVQSFMEEYITRNEDAMDAWIQIQDHLLQLYECLGIEAEKQELCEMNRLKRKHDYMPFIRSFVQALLEEGHLHSIIS